MAKQLRVLSIPGHSFGQNPYWRLFCEGLEGVGGRVVDPWSLAALTLRFDVLHLHLPDHQVTEPRSTWQAIARATILLGLVTVSRLFGRPVVWTVHDVRPFNPRHQWLLKPYLASIRRLVGGYVFLSDAAMELFYQDHPSARTRPCLRTPHGPYPTGVLDSSRRSEIRRHLAGDGNPFLAGFIGDIRPTKGIGALGDLPERDSSGRRVLPVIVGRADGPLATAQLDAFLTSAAGAHAIRRDERPTDDEFVEFLQAVDAVLLPYKYGWNSGLAMLALSAGARVVASDLPMFVELERSFGAPWFYVFHSAANGPSEVGGLASTILEMSRTGISEKDRMRLSSVLDTMAFDKSSRKLVDFYECLRSGAPERRS